MQTPKGLTLALMEFIEQLGRCLKTKTLIVYFSLNKQVTVFINYLPWFVPLHSLVKDWLLVWGYEEHVMAEHVTSHTRWMSIL
jgi:hypothetical protein